ncbi:MAG: primosomal protein N' [Deltaproteobacteria bacterium]|nr:primosomal protein N' [Deltaproteobacteria bacterium]
MKGNFAQIAVELPVEGSFSYAIPAALKAEARLGMRVLVPFGKRVITGYVTAITDEPGVKNVKEIMDVLDPEPLFDEKRLKFFRWMSDYYFAPQGETLSLIHPPFASIKSRRFLTLTEAGAQALEKKDGLSGDILKAAEKGVSLGALLRRLGSRPVHAAVTRLIKDGLLLDEVRLKSGGSARVERFAEAVNRKETETLPDFKNAPLQARVYEHIRDKGGASLAALRQEFGAVDGAVKRLAAMGLVNVMNRPRQRDPFSDVVPRPSNHEPNAEQMAAISAIADALRKDAFSPFLLYGVTGSGKTLVYLRAIEEAVTAGKKAIFLVPEIALTSWPAAYLSEMFPGRVALNHSGLSEGERFDEWQRIVKGKADIVVGARSALFSPLKGLGLVIVDEEHETSYKQEDGVRYNARDAALMLGKYLGITVVLGSATPSMESFYNAKTGKFTPLTLKKRVEERAMPVVELMDMRGRRKEVVSEKLRAMMDETLTAKDQALLFLNRRGFSSSIICKDCGYSFGCQNCSVTLTLHKRPAPGMLRCHYCDMTAALPDSCPKCKGLNLTEPGMGTEKIEEEVAAVFPGAAVVRMDRDTTSKKGAVKNIISAVEEKRADVLIGTQMVSKGHHFPGIVLVGIISGDTSLNIPDFRGAERTFHLVTQAAGRAGRGELPGRVVIQTLSPDHYVFKNAVTHDYDGFYEDEIALRKEVFYPPFSRLAAIRVEGAKEDVVMRAAFDIKTNSEILLKRHAGDIIVLGPAPALISKVKGRFRWQLLVKGGSKDIRGMHAFVSRLKSAFDSKKHGGVTMTVDMDPISVV